MVMKFASKIVITSFQYKIITLMSTLTSLIIKLHIKVKSRVKEKRNGLWCMSRMDDDDDGATAT